MEENDNKELNPRRDFLKTTALGIAATAAVATCGSAACSCKKPTDATGETGEKVTLLSPDGELVQIDTGHLKYVPKNVVVSKEEARQGIPGRKFVMVIDLAKCANAGKCKKACSKMHYLPPEKSYIKIEKMSKLKSLSSQELKTLLE